MKQNRPTTRKKTTTKLAKKRFKADIRLAIAIGLLVTAVGILYVRLSGASAHKTFTRTVNQMQGGTLKSKTAGVPVRSAAEPAPGVNPVYTLVAGSEMKLTKKVCADVRFTKPNSWINVEYHSATAGLAQSPGHTGSSGAWTECVVTNFQDQSGTINVNVTPGSADVISIYGLDQ